MVDEARKCADFLLSLDPSDRFDVEREVMGENGKERPDRPTR
jgi:hypothetical protein